MAETGSRGWAAASRMQAGAQQTLGVVTRARLRRALQNYCGQNVRSSFVFPAAVDWEGRTTEGRQSGGQSAAYCKNTVKGHPAGTEVPAEGAGRGADGHAVVWIHLCGSPAVRRTGEHHPQLDGRGSRPERRLCKRAAGCCAGDRHPGQPRGEGAGELFAEPCGREPAGRAGTEPSSTGSWTRTLAHAASRSAHCSRATPRSWRTPRRPGLWYMLPRAAMTGSWTSEKRKLLDAQLERYSEPGDERQKRRCHGHRADDRGRKGCGDGTRPRARARAMPRRWWRSGPRAGKKKGRR